MSKFKDMMIDVQEMLEYNKYSYREVADMFGITVADVERIDEIMNGKEEV
jgi:predicted XRE-type DNA-binding protein